MSVQGQTIKQFKVLQPLGKGGMGEVWLGEDTILKRKVAIKFLPPNLQDDIVSRERFLREALAAAALDHPFICKIYETGEIDGKAYIVMEYIEGQDLKDRMKGDPLPMKEILRIILEIAEALAKAHANGIVHRDLKPANIMLTPDHRVKIMDFGLAKRVTEAEAQDISRTIPALAEEDLSQQAMETTEKARVLQPSEEDLSQDVTTAIGTPPIDSTKPVEQDLSQDVTIAVEAPPSVDEAKPAEHDISQDVTIAVEAPPSVDAAKPTEPDLSQEVTMVTEGPQSAELTQQGMIVGTVAYMSPEQGRGDEVDGRSDIFSLGVILYEMVTKKHPFMRNTPIDTLKSVISTPHPPLKMRQKRVSSALSPILNKALAKEVAKRYQNIEDFVKAIEKMQKVTHLGSPLFYLRWQAIVSLVVIVGVIVFGVWRYARRAALASQIVPDPISVLVADFQNQTGDEVFNGAVEQAMNIGLEGASFISAFKRTDARRIAEELDPDFEGILDVETSQLVSVREGISKFIDGAIEPAGEGFEIIVWVRDPVDPESLKQFSKKINSKEAVLNAAAWLANKVRKNLGDISADASAALKGETFTTTSLEAMKAYTTAQELQLTGKREEAIVEFENALSFDPNFGRAYAGLGATYYNLNKIKESEESYEAAIKLIGTMTDREKFRTRGGYYLMKKNYQNAIDELTSLIEQFPADAAGHANLAFAYYLAYNMPKAYEMGKKALELTPNNINAHYNLGWYAMAALEYEEAETAARATMEIFPSYEKAYVLLALSQLARDQFTEAMDTYGQMKSLSSVGASLDATGRADFAVYEGRLNDAATILKQGIDTDLEENLTDLAVDKYAILAHVYALQGNKSLAVQTAEKTIADAAKSREGEIFYAMAGVYLEVGEEEKALALADELSKRLSKDNQAFALLIKGYASLIKGYIPQAVNFFTEAQGLSDTWHGRFALGRAYLEAEEYTEASSEFENCEKRRGEAMSIFLNDLPTFRYLDSLQYYKGRAMEGLGIDGTAETYQKYLTIKENEDWGDPLVKDARERLSFL